ncbi:MAG TPA: DUF3300 domain-containing protein [Terriglobia bacterium]|nr:DUF3300 domain-containing protein [Terriglobia bacterium]
MNSALSKHISSLLVSFALLCATMPTVARAQQPSGDTYSGQGAALTAQDLQSIVAPIALYPDALVAQILAASTFTDQVAAADDWLRQNQNLTGQALAQAVNSQPWDPSVKALTQFPSVLDNMANNLSWTSSLGEAYHNQAADVMSAVQTLRAQAMAAGNLKSSSQIKVVQQSPQTIVIEPANPEVVYVPQYDPALVYGTPYVIPGYSTADVVASSVIGFGAGIAVGALMNEGWGWNSWNMNWAGGAAYYGAHPYYGNAAWHGGYYGAGGSAYGRYGSANYGRGYNPSTGTYARGASVNTPYGSQKVGQAYNPRTGAYGATHQGSNAYSNWGSSAFSKNGQSAYTQHYSNAQGSVGTMQTSNGGRAAASSTAYGNSFAGKTASGNEYAAHNGNAYKNTGSGWQNVNKPGGSSFANSDAARGWGQKESGASSAFKGAGNEGWGSRADSARGWASRGGGGGWGGRGGGGGFRGGRR